MTKLGNIHRIAALNVESGVYRDYLETDEKPNLDALARCVKALGADSVVISDAYGLDDYWLRRLAMPEFRHTAFVPLDDDRINEKHDLSSETPQIGVAFGTNATLLDQEVIDLGNRQGLSSTLNIGRHGLRIAGVYLDDLSEDVRSRQIRALLAYLDKEDIPTVVAGDLNSQEALKWVGLSERIRSGVVKFGATALKAVGHPYGDQLLSLESRIALEQLRGAGYESVATKTKDKDRPTALFPIAPMFRVDHGYVRGVEASGYRVGRAMGASDHRPIVFDINV